MIKFFRPYRNMTDREGYAHDALVEYAKIPNVCKAVHHDMGNGFGRVEEVVIQWKKYLRIDLWFVKLDFQWLSPKTFE